MIRRDKGEIKLFEDNLSQSGILENQDKHSREDWITQENIPLCRQDAGRMEGEKGVETVECFKNESNCFT